MACDRLASCFQQERDMRTISVAAGLMMLVCLVVRGEDAPKPIEVSATDKAALTAAMGKDVVVSGTIKQAHWSATGKVMNIEFADSELIGAVFAKNKEEIYKAFDGDA